jgi:hypothetical protein
MQTNETFLPNLSKVAFGRDNADKVAELLGFDIRTLAPQSRFQYRRIGSDPVEGYMLPDGRVVLIRSRQMVAIADVVVWPDRAEWQAWRTADGLNRTVWRIAED